MNAEEIKSRFWFGTHYYRPPTPLESEWQDDFKRLADYGLTTIQVRVFWRWYERARNRYVWDDLDRFMDAAGKGGLKVVHQICLENAPQYIFDDYEGFRVDIRGQRIWPISPPAFYPGGWIPCFDIPQVMKFGVKFVRRLVMRYRTHDALEFWHAWNEPRARPMGECACPYSIQTYRKWLEERFTTIDALNERFGKCWGSFSQVDAARDIGDFAEMFLWRQWCASRVKARVSEVVDEIRQFDTDHAVISHVGLNSLQQDTLTDISDDEQMADVADMYGSSFEVRYTPQPLQQSMPFMICDWMRHVCNGNYTIYELYPSRGRFEGEIPPEQVQQWLWTPLACGANSVFLWQFKKERLGFETNDAGLIEIDGSDNPTSIDAKETFNLYKEFGHQLATWKTPRARIGIVYDLQSDLLNRIETTVSREGDYVGRYEMKCDMPFGTPYKAALHGVYHLLWLNNIHADVVSSARLEQAMDQYDLLYLPAMYVVDRKRAELLCSFVANGGRLIADAGFARRDSNTWLHGVRPGAGLHERFGYRESNCRIAHDLRTDLLCGDQRLNTAFERITFDPTSASSSAKWADDNSCAAVTGEIGKGRFLVLGFSPGMSYLTKQDSQWSDLINELVCSWGEIDHAYWADRDDAPGVTVREMIDPEGKRVVFAFRRTGHDGAWATFSISGAKTLFELSHVKCLRID